MPFSFGKTEVKLAVAYDRNLINLYIESIIGTYLVSDKNIAPTKFSNKYSKYVPCNLYTPYRKPTQSASAFYIIWTLDYRALC